MEQATNSPLHHRDHPVAAPGRTRGIYANRAPKVGGQAPEQIVPARWNSTAAFAANTGCQPDIHVSPLPDICALWSLGETVAALEHLNVGHTIGTRALSSGHVDAVQ